MEGKNLSEQDKRNYLAQNGWETFEKTSDIKDARYVPKNLSEGKFVPLNLEDAYDVCLKTEEVNKLNKANEEVEKKKTEKYNIAINKIATLTNNGLIVNYEKDLFEVGGYSISFDEISKMSDDDFKNYTEYLPILVEHFKREYKPEPILEEKRFVDKEQMINIPMKYYEILRRIEDEAREKELGQGYSEPKRYEEKYSEIFSHANQTETVQKLTETDRVIGRMERLLNRISANTAHLSEITRKLCFDNSAQPIAGDVGVDKTEPRTSIEKLDLLLDEGNRVADHLAYLVEFQSNVI